MSGEYGVILVATDFSTESDHAFRIACNVAGRQCSRLVVLHVVPPSTRTDVDYDPCRVDEDRPEVRHGREQFDRLRTLGGNVPLTFRIVVGYPVGMILNVAHQEGAELIVIASHRGSQITFQVHGPVSDGVLRRAHCPVLCLRQPISSASRIGSHPGEKVDMLN